MSSEKVPCPVCGEVFDDKEAATAHMKEKHRDEFSHPEVPPVGRDESPQEEENPSEVVVDLPPIEGVTSNVIDPLALLPPEIMAAMEKKMDERIEVAFEAERPRVIKAMEVAIENVVKKATAAGFTIPGVTGNPAEGGVVQGSPVTPAGAELIKLMFGGGGGGGQDLEGFIRQANQFKAIGELFNPPASLTERIMQTAYIKSLKNVGLVTDKQMQDVEKALLGDVE